MSSQLAGKDGLSFNAGGTPPSGQSPCAARFPARGSIARSPTRSATALASLPIQSLERQADMRHAVNLCLENDRAQSAPSQRSQLLQQVSAVNDFHAVARADGQPDPGRGFQRRFGEHGLEAAKLARRWLQNGRQPSSNCQPDGQARYCLDQVAKASPAIAWSTIDQRADRSARSPNSNPDIDDEQPLQDNDLQIQQESRVGFANVSGHSEIGRRSAPPIDMVSSATTSPAVW